MNLRLKPMAVEERALLTLICASLFWPTSINGQISRAVTAIGFVVVLLLIIVLLISNRTKISLIRTSLALLIYSALCFFTIISMNQSDGITEGAVLSRLVMCSFFVLFLVRIERVNFFLRILSLCEFIFILQLCSISLNLTIINTFFSNFYDYYWDGLVAHMLLHGKPVGTFAIHSLAGFAAFLFFYVRLRMFNMKPTLTNFTMLMLNLIVLYALRSFTGLVFLALSLCILLVRLPRKYQLAFVFLAVGTALTMHETILSWSKEILSAHHSGPLSRYSKGTPVRETLDIIFSPSFHPVGFGLHPNVFYGDSGVVELLLRGGALVLAMSYLLLFSFLRANVKRTSDILVLLASVLAFEVGFSLIKDLRFFGLLALAIVVLRAIDESQRVINFSGSHFRLKWVQEKK
jgi:hypothetical protein